MFGGTNVSELFEEHPTRHLEMFDLKSQSDYGSKMNLFWWNDPTFVIGAITTQERNVCVHNKSKGEHFTILFCKF